MIEATEIQVIKAERSRLKSLDLENMPFGKYFTDHMLEADYKNGEWKHVKIKPFQPLMISPANAALHYGQSIFEGIKAYRMSNGEVAIFRPFDNYRRFNVSADRIAMPEVPEEIFVEGMKQLVALDSGWVPEKMDYSLYIRPIMFASDEVIGVKPSDNYKFLILLSPTGPYYPAPMRIYVEEQYVRAVPGGVGYAKVAGNYAAALRASAEARSQGYDQVLWMDAAEHKYVQEIGTMNVFFIIGNTAFTPNLDDGTILAGVTRDSVIQIMKQSGIEVQERPIHIDEITAAYQNGELKEVFGTGTAATISLIKELKYKNLIMHFDPEQSLIATGIKSKMNEIRYGLAPDNFGWMVKV